MIEPVLLRSDDLPLSCRFFQIQLIGVKFSMLNVEILEVDRADSAVLTWAFTDIVGVV